MQSTLLLTRHKRQRHTADNLAAEMLETFHEFNITNKVTAGLTDKANNVIAAVDQLEHVEHLGCFAHTLNLAVKHAINDDLPTKTVVKKVKGIVSHFRTSMIALNQLKDQHVKDNKVFKKLIQEVDTRWNSTFLMLQSLKTQHDQVTVVLSLRKKNDLLLDKQEMATLEEAHDSQKTAYDVTKEVSGGKYTIVKNIFYRQADVKRTGRQKTDRHCQSTEVPV